MKQKKEEPKEYKVYTVKPEEIEFVLEKVRKEGDLLKKRTNLHTLILDLSDVELLDSVEMGLLEKTLENLKLQGFQPIIVGLRPGVVYSAVQLGFNTTRLLQNLIFLRLNEALQYLSED